MNSLHTGEAGLMLRVCLTSRTHLNFTIVTPNFNMGNYLGETVESVLANLTPGDEYFIIDGGSTDNSLDVIRSYESRITGWVSERDKGYADALAKGFKRSTAGFQCWINSGDLLLKGALNTARQLLENGSADMIFGDDLYIGEQGTVLQVSNGHVANLLEMMLYGGWTPLQDACYWRGSLYEKVGGINPEVRYAADFDLFLRMSLNGRCHYVPTVFSAFRRHRGQTSKARANDYRIERERIRRKTLNAISPTGWFSGFAIYYFLLARMRARLWYRYRNDSRLVGKSVYDLQCTETKKLLVL